MYSQTLHGFCVRFISSCNLTVLFYLNRYFMYNNTNFVQSRRQRNSASDKVHFLNEQYNKIGIGFKYLTNDCRFLNV
ncbi:unnamed protein product [Rotaria magnacalcarata]